MRTDELLRRVLDPAAPNGTFDELTDISISEFVRSLIGASVAA